MNNIKSINSKRNSFSYKWNNINWTISFDDEYLYKKWKSKKYSGTKIFTLTNLIPKFETETFADAKSVKHIRISLALILFSIVFYFSDYFKSIPLLLPFLLFYAFVFFPKPISTVLSQKWLYIFDNYGNHTLSIYVQKNESDEERRDRKLFEKNLSKQIEKAIVSNFCE